MSKLEGEALGTTYHISFYSKEEIDLSSALDSLFDVINGSMSTYQDDSDISRINSGEEGVRVDEMFEEVFGLSQQIYQESGGYFDPTVGDIVNLYGFGAEEAVVKPDSSKVDSLMRFVGMDKLKLSNNGTLTKTIPGVYLEFNAIAKGYAIDVIGNYLDSRGVEHYLIELGGELLGKGKNIDKGDFWTVGVDNPEQEEGQARKLIAVLELQNRAMATSGNYRKFRIDKQTGERYVHTINPLTGFPEKGDLLSATVLAPSCALSDGYATAFMAMGFGRAKSLVSDLEQVDVLFLYLDEQGEMQEYVTAGFQEVLLE